MNILSHTLPRSFAFRFKNASVRIHPYVLATQSNLRQFCTKKDQESSKDGNRKTDEEYDSEEEVTLKVKDIRNLLKDQDTEIESLKMKIDSTKAQEKHLVEENERITVRYQDEKEKAKNYFGYVENQYFLFFKNSYI